MSKRLSNQSNTLFNYFTPPKRDPNIKTESIGNSNLENVETTMEIKPDSDDEEVIGVKTKKRSRILVADSDTDSENENKESVTPLKNGKAKKVKLDSFASSKKSDDQSCTSKSLESFSCKSSKEAKPPNADTSTKETSIDMPFSDKIWLHNTLDFLKPEKIRDINKNRPGHPDYDERTLYVSEEFLNKLTPAMRQWWILKSRHMDAVLFFKVGKFYELYHMDAVVGVNNLGFSYMKGEFAHSGFPESAYGKMASSLIEQGFKIARVEQTETPEMMAERCRTSRKSGKFDKVVNREICQISAKGSCIYGAQMPEAKQDLSFYMLALAERDATNKIRYGVCLLDTSTGTFFISEFEDDKHCSRLLALFAQYPPSLVLTERGHISTSTLNVFKKSVGNVRREVLAPDTQFFSATKTLEKLAECCYFQNKDGEVEWPCIFQNLAEDGIPKSGYELALKSLGACMWFLKDCEIDIQILSMKKFKMYHPIDTSNESNTERNHMILDAITIENLKLLGGAGTVQKTLDFCKTPFGKRLLQQWICRPLCDIEKIKERQAAVAELLEKRDVLQSARNILQKLPDLERQVAKIHTFGNKFCAEYHPDSRAIFYEAKRYSKRKIFDLLNTLRGFEKAQEITPIFSDCQSRLLRKLTQNSPKGMFLNLDETLKFFKGAFDQKKAESEGKIIPQPGVDEGFDEAEERIATINQELQEYLEEQQKFFGCKVTYFGSDKKRFQLDVPENKSRKVTAEYQLEGTKKGSKPSKRYSTSVTRKFLADMIKSETERAKIVQDLNRRIFEKFSDRHQEWEQLIQCLTILDVLCCLAEYGRSYSEEICVPTVLPLSQNPIIKIRNGRHPCILTTENFVPNDTELGTEGHHNILLLTGPNMGGKSTLMRQVAVIVIMAQIGSVVPASECEINLVDRIFTRLGAYDDIMQGSSTFLVELSEASVILQHATVNSFVLLDELGRGTSTHDGNAIATAYVKKLTEIKCRTMFATHYHSLVEYFAGWNNIQLGHMACMVEGDDESDISQESVTFLYKIAEGSCPKSYGFNAARLAGLPLNIICRAYDISRELEEMNKNRQMMCNLLEDASSARKLIALLK